ncbi:threonine-phosphate decarboxylase [Pseudoruegeria sp. SHC-113]|uniref:threonine-phosphate decarboxylase n=1 Tax=Pseudoruegeria sp. SHC-113 TaxID=2855439 RepID=UPI0021BA692D|nr:threonine-phosphate decarboxylase [Pseudoruegeria sp. SHC-113]MCT8159201.1 pyridoxal phosphate-dependent class II aminotransferase [Pseudoruegeria sp. SHC-113]
MTPRDHGGGIDAAIARFGGTRESWLDLSTGINPVPYPVGTLPADAWTALPDAAAFAALESAARRFWAIPEGAAVLPAPGASAIIARTPLLRPPGRAHIQSPTYNEHAAAFTAAGWQVEPGTAAAAPDLRVAVHPNNPDGRFWNESDLSKGGPALTVIDESFCDIAPQASHIARATYGQTLILKSFGKFWGLAGLRLGFAIGAPALIAPLKEALGPWQVSGPALAIGARALSDDSWAQATRARLAADSARLDGLMARDGAQPLGGTPLFRLFAMEDAGRWQEALARSHVWSRIFPYNKSWLRLGLPAPDRWTQFETALEGLTP